jgi:hypothetical protein
LTTTASSKETINRAGRRPSTQPPRTRRRLTYDGGRKTPPCFELGKSIQYEYDHVTTSTTKIRYCRCELEKALADDTFGEIISRLVEQQRACKQIDFNAVIPLAHLLVKAGCRKGSGLWIAMKFATSRRYMPGSSLMAFACKLQNKKTLIAREAEDLKMLNWDIAPYARRCNLLS